MLRFGDPATGAAGARDQREEATGMTDVVAGAATDTGAVREQNEDAVAIWDEQSPHLETNGRLFALADGMGGHRRGEVASAEAVKILFERFYAEPVSDVALALKQALRQANDLLYQEGAANGLDQMMGTTLVAGVIRRNLLTVANVGDSRAYIVRGGRAQQVTRDHSVVAEQVQAGKLTAEEARTSRNRNVITRALGHQPRVEVDIFEVPLLPRDGVVLASDGLYHAVSDDELAALALEGTPAAAAAALVRLARERESGDNASAVVVHYERAATAALPVTGRDLFETAELPRREPVAARGPAPLLIAAAVLAALVVVAIVALALSGVLAF
jgi:protein phosphatase